MVERPCDKRGGMKMVRMVKGLYVSPDCVKVCEVDDDRGCEGYYELLGCETIEAPDAWFTTEIPGSVSLENSGDYFDIICDEEALCHGEIPACTVAMDNRDGTATPWIHGPCFVCKANEDGEWVSPTDEEIAALKAHVAVVDGRFTLMVS